MRSLFICIAFALTCSGSALADTNIASDSAVDHSKPENVLDAVFTAARTSNPKLLNGLCDPKGEGDGDTKALCELHLEHSRWAEFKRYFEKGVRISAVPRFRGDRAVLNFLFGPDGKKPEEMNLIRRNERWYLLSF